MAKLLQLRVDRYQTVNFLSPVRAKRDVILIWMDAIKAFLVNLPAAPDQSTAVLSINVMSMSRLFCELDGGRKIFSVAFPFSIHIDDKDGTFSFYSREGLLIDSRVSSQLVALVEGSGVLEAADFGYFFDSIIDAVDVNQDIWPLLRELILAEDGYVRYDWDTTRANGHLHPEHHIDLCYTANSTFKIGLRSRIDCSALISILNIETDCLYLQPLLPTSR